MSTYPIRRPMLFLVVAVLSAFLLVRIGIGWWAWYDSPDVFETQWMHYWLTGTVLGALVLLGAGLGCTWFIIRTRAHDREVSRQRRLAELGLLAGGLTHEIRNTLNAMRTRIAIVRKQCNSEPDSAAAKQITKLEQAIEDLEGLTSDFLAFARPAEDNLKETELQQLIPEVLDFTALDLEHGNIAVETELPASLPKVYVDSAKVKRALLNLIINARQAMADGGTLTVRACWSGKRAVVIEVQDTGAGIPDAERSKIFDTFYSSKPDGAGLGLAIVKRTVEDCGGRVTVESQEGHGTTFRVYLPIAEEWRKTVGSR